MPFSDFINLTHAYAWHQANLVKKTPDEPGLVSAYISKPMVTELERVVRQCLPHVKHFVANGIFTHKTPTVQPQGAPNSVEIGDMLFIRQHISKNIPTIGRAFLLQAKRNVNPSSGNVASGNPKIQFDLYQNWPKFVGTSRISAGCMGKPNWDFKPSHKGQPFGRYLAIFDGHAFDPPGSPIAWTGAPIPVPSVALGLFKGNTSWGYGDVTATTNPSIGVPCGQDFADLLKKFVLGKEGAPFTPGLMSDTDHWSTFVNEMLGIAAQSNYTYLSARTGVTLPQSRNSSISAFQVAITLDLLAQRDRPRRFFLSPYLHHLFWFDPESREIERELLSLLDGDSEYPPPFRHITDFIPPDEPGHPPILSLITIGDECPDGLRASL